MILQIFYITFVLFIWFETDAFISYSKLLRLSHFFKIDKWEEYKREYYLMLLKCIIKEIKY